MNDLEMAILNSLAPGFREKVLELVAYGEGLFQYIDTARFSVTSYYQPEVAGWRTVKQQYQFYRRKKSECDGTIKKSKHQFGHAIHLGVRLRDGERYVDWDKHTPSQRAKMEKVIAKASELGLEWGGNWASFKDPDHFESGLTIAAIESAAKKQAAKTTKEPPPDWV